LASLYEDYTVFQKLNITGMPRLALDGFLFTTIIKIVITKNSPQYFNYPLLMKPRRN
jgi:hypothetical protein